MRSADRNFCSTPTSGNINGFQIFSNYSPRVHLSRAGCLGRGWYQGVTDGGKSAPAVAAAGFDN
jgi:hypothetical protein